MYYGLNKLCKEMDKISAPSTITARDFNAKIGKRNGSEADSNYQNFVR